MTKAHQPGAVRPHRVKGAEPTKPVERAPDQQKLAKVLLGVDEVAKKELKRLKRAEQKVRDRAVDKIERDGDSSEPSVGHERAYAVKPDGTDFGVAGVLLAKQEIQAHGLEDARRQREAEEEEDDLPTLEEIVTAARQRVQRFGRNYGVNGLWKSPNPGIPGNIKPDETAVGGLMGHWKSNHFCLDTLYQAGFEVPAIEGEGDDDEDAGWYPMAADLVIYAQGPARIFNSVMSLKLDSRTRKQRRARITELLRLSKVGDLIVHRYGPEEQSDSYLVSLVTGNRMEEIDEVECAEACRDRARLLSHPVNDLVDAQGVLLLRPIRPRYDDE